jgi:hypothetical protein
MGRFSHRIPVCSTNKIPHKHLPNGQTTPAWTAESAGPHPGSNGSMRFHHHPAQSTLSMRL